MIIKTFPNSKASSFSRYKKYDVVVDDEGYQYVESFEKALVRYRESDTYYTVESEDENRIDKISYRFYRNPFYWWYIAVANDIDDPLIIPAGITLRIPSLGR